MFSKNQSYNRNALSTFIPSLAVTPSTKPCRDVLVATGSVASEHPVSLYVCWISRVLPVLPMSLYCSMDCYCSPVNVCWQRFTIKYAGIPSSQTSLWASFIPLPLIRPHRLLALIPWVLLWRWDLLTAHSSIGHFSLSHDADFEHCCRYWSLVDKWMVVLNGPVLPHEADLLHSQWMRLNRLRCGTAQVGDTTKLWGTQESIMYLRTPDTVGAACGCALCDTGGPSRMVLLVSPKAWKCIHYFSNSLDIIQKEYFLRIFQSVFFILPIIQYNFLLKILSWDLLAMQT